MAELSCFQKYRKESSGDYIIISTDLMVTKLRGQIVLFKESEVDEEFIFQTVIEALAFEKNAQMELNYGCLDVIRHHLGSPYMEDFDNIAEAISDFGMEMLSYLKQMKAYKNGYLFYQYMQVLGADLVLVRIVPPLLNR